MVPRQPPARRVVQRAVRWYADHARPLPWREQPTPYAVLLSELMAQQTRIETVLPFHARFLERWPTLADLAAATEQEVVEAWAGLGYYRRARNLHRCAREALARGGLPREPEALRELPGIGPYTAGAVASIAFGVRTPAVDGNVERLLSRVDGREEDPRSPAGRRALRARAEALHAAAPRSVHAGVLNQALMELGATVCTPAARCDACPLAEDCVALRTGRTAELPRRPARQPPRAIFGIALVAAVPDGVVLGRRPPGGLLGGLWEPLRATVPGPSEPAELAPLLTLLDSPCAPRPCGDVVHVFTHRRLTASVYAVQARALAIHRSAVYAEIRAVADPSAVGMSALGRKVLQCAG